MPYAVVTGAPLAKMVPPILGDRKIAACFLSSFQGASSFVVVVGLADDDCSVSGRGASGALIESVVDENENIKLLLAALLEVGLDTRNGCLLGV